MWACSCPLLQWGISHWAKDCQREKAKTWDSHCLWRKWIFHPPGWGGFLSNRGECCCSCRWHKLIVSPFPAKADRHRDMHLVMFWSAWCMYWHRVFYITCGTRHHKISSLNLYWRLRFSHCKLKPKTLSCFSFLWNSKVHDLGKKHKMQSHLKRANLISGFIAQAGSLLQKLSSWLICIINHLNRNGLNFKE